MRNHLTRGHHYFTMAAASRPVVGSRDVGAWDGFFSFEAVRCVFLKLFERIHAPLTAGLLSTVTGHTKLQHQERYQLDRLYRCVIDDLHKLMDACELKAARYQCATRSTSSLSYA